MRPLYASTAMALMFGLMASADAAGTKTEQTANQQAGQTQGQSPKQQMTREQQQQPGQIRPGDQQAQGQQSSNQDRQMQARRSIDTNQDGQISAEETQAYRERTFSSLDANSDGKLSRQEVGGITAIEPGYVVITRMVPVALAADVGSQMLAAMDQDQNRQVSRQEYMQYGEQEFQKAQEQAGGKLSAVRAEMNQEQTGEAQTSQAQQAKSGQNQAQQGQSGQSQQAQSGQTESGQGQTPGWQEVVRWREADVDQNGDGTVSDDEAAAAWSQTFNELDRNGNNQLSQDELKQIDEQKAMVDERFKTLDANGDGHVSKDEFTKAGDDLMQRADFNSDGDVTAWEYRALRIHDL